jgi:anti-anti-sigma factor
MKTVASIMGTGPQAASASPMTKPGTVTVADGKTLKCPNCKHLNTADAQACKRCGLPLSTEVTIDDQNDLVVIKINLSEFDFETHTLLRPVFKSVMKKKIVIDVSGVKWMDSTGIGALVTITYQSARTGQSIKIVGMNKKIFDAVKSLQVDNVLELCGDVNACRVEWGLPPV